MSYTTYITEALVCGSENRHTGDRSFLLFTREAGMLYGAARSVREERSKQRYALQDFSYARLTLVRGKSGWRIAGAEATQNVYFSAETREARSFIMRTVTLLRRTIHGETPHSRIFDDVVTALYDYRLHNLAQLELVLTLRVLSELGYISPSVAYNRFLENTLTPELTALLPEPEIAPIQGAIQRALMESQL